MAVALDEYIERLTTSGVVTPDELTAFLKASPAAKPQDGDALAKALLRAKKLTPFQAQMLHQNKGKSLVLGNYLIVDKLGQGGMGMVLKAVHRRMERTVALKVLSPTVTKTQDMLQRFQREVRAAARLTHPNIVAAFDADEAKGTHYLVMEYVDGIDLSVQVKKHGPLALDQAVNCILQAAKGLKYAHDHGVVHRDIKPANLLLDASGTVKILDMGLARLDAAPGDIGGQAADLTSTGSIMGTVDYMSPEQALDTKKANAQSDVYSLGCALHYLLTGKAVYEGDTVMKRLLAHREQPIPALAPLLTARGFAADAAGRVDRVFRKMVAKKPEERYAAMGGVVADLEACLKGSEPAAIPISAPAAGDQQLGSFLAGLSASDIIAGTKTATQARTGTVTDSATQIASAISDTAVREGRSGMTRGRRKSPSSLLSDRRVWYVAGGAVVLSLAALIPLLSGGPGGIRFELNDPSLTVVVPLATGNVNVSTSRLLELPAGQYVLKVSWTGDEFNTLPVEVVDGEVVDVSVKRTPYSIVAMRGATKIGGVELPVEEQAAPRAVASTPTTTPEPLSGTFWDRGTPIETGHETAEQGVDNALWFDGATIVRETTLRMLPATEFTIEGWVTPQMTQPVHSIVFGGNGAPWITIRPELEWGFEGGVEMPILCLSGAGTYRPNERTHVAGVFDNGEVRLYLNGKLSGRSDAPAKDYKLPQFGVVMGSVMGNFQGVVDEVRFSSVARYEGDFQPTLRFQPDSQTLALYHFDEGKANLANDATGRGYDALIEGERYEWVKVTDARVGQTVQGWQGWPPDAPRPAIAPFDAPSALNRQLAWADYLGVPMEYTNSIGMKFRLIPPGEFMMGSPQGEIDAALAQFTGDATRERTINDRGPQHRVILTRPYYLSLYEVTQRDFQMVMGRNPSQFSASGAQKAIVAGVDTQHFPVEGITWLEAVEFCNQLNAREKLAALDPDHPNLTARSYRLPTEGEWEYACRAGTSTRYWTGDDDAAIESAAWIQPNSDGQTHPVGKLLINPFGMSDMHGNVKEWCLDWWDSGYYGEFAVEPALNPPGAATGAERVARDGGWDMPARLQHSAARTHTTPTTSNARLGMRILLPVEVSPGAMR